MSVDTSGWPVESDGSVTITTVTTGAVMINGFLRSPSGALVVVMI